MKTWSTVEDLPASFQEALAGFTAFRRLGFTADQIFAGWNFGRVLVELQAQGRTFTLDFPCPDVAEADFIEKWRLAAELWNGSTLAEQEKIFQKSYVRKHSIEFAAAMVHKGFVVSKSPGFPLN